MWIGTDDFHMGTTDDEIKALREGIETAGFYVSSVALTMVWDNPICGPEDFVQERAIEIAACQIAAANLFGTDAFLVVTGRHSTDNDTSAALNRIVSGFKRIDQVAADAGVKVGAETCPRLSFNLMTSLECTAFDEAVGNPAMGIYLDTANVTYSGYPSTSYVRLAMI